MKLFDPGRHVRPPPSPWDPARARRWLARWAEAALADRIGFAWPVHPREAIDFPAGRGPLWSVYFGAAGVWFALARLAAAQGCPLPADLGEIFLKLLDEYARTPDDDAPVPSWLLGDSALLTACCLTGRDLSERLAATIRGNRDNPTRELLWGAPGTMLAALFLYKHTGEGRWAELVRDSADALFSSWFYDPAQDAWLWEQELYGEQVRYVGAGHGWAGNVGVLWRARALLDASQQSRLRERTLHTLARLALHDGDRVNWPPIVGSLQKMLVQWCHGAPGVITALRHADVPEALPLLLAGGRLIVAAGPLEKGVGLCHGTDGNGVALLELHRRTGDPAWLEHARAFAMAALEQSEADFKKYGQWRHSLFTGDAGLACFLLDCLEGEGRGVPGIDLLW